MDIKGSVALVTGANRGLGKSLVQALLAAGARKVYVGSRTLIETTDSRVQPLKLDITNAQDVAAAAEAAQDVNILVNNAGVATFASFLTTTSLNDAREAIETNYFGTLAMVQAFAPILKRNGGGTIVNILSVVSWFTSPFLGTYSVSKAAEWSLTNGIRVELRSQGTQVVGVHVGYMDTDMTANIKEPKISPEEVAARVIEGVLADQEEVLADQSSHEIRATLASNPKAFYQYIQQNWDQSQQTEA